MAVLSDQPDAQRFAEQWVCGFVEGQRGQALVKVWLRAPRSGSTDVMVRTLPLTA